MKMPSLLIFAQQLALFWLLDKIAEPFANYVTLTVVFGLPLSHLKFSVLPLQDEMQNCTCYDSHQSHTSVYTKRQYKTRTRI